MEGVVAVLVTSAAEEKHQASGGTVSVNLGPLVFRSHDFMASPLIPRESQTNCRAAIFGQRTNDVEIEPTSRCAISHIFQKTCLGCPASRKSHPDFDFRLLSRLS
jgi:hypothetical protein